MERRFILKPQYIPYTNSTFGNLRLHSFQKVLMNLEESEEDCLIISAPTGAGKTFGFCLPTLASTREISGKRKTLIISPTNALIQQTRTDIEKQSHDLDNVLSIDSFSAKDLRTKGIGKAIEMYDRIATNDIVVTNPDLLTLLVAGQYIKDFKQRNVRVRQWSTIFRTVSTIIFDEYHIYSEEELGKVLSFILLAKATGNDHIRYVFASATPKDKLKDVLDSHNIGFREVKEEVLDGETEGRPCRLSKGRLDLIFTDLPLLDSIVREIPSRGKTLFLFDKVIDCQRAIDQLEANGIDDWNEISGFETRAKKKRKSMGNEIYTIATNAAEQGLNLEVDVAHIEPGLFLENFWQRLGRTARRGKDGVIYVHISSPMMESIPDSVKDYYHLGEVMISLLEDRTIYSSRMHIHAGAFLYLVWKRCKNEALREQVRTVGCTFPTFMDFDRTHREIQSMKNVSTWPASEDITKLERWWDGYLDAFGWFRGQSRTVKVILPRSDHSETEADLIWLKRNCEYERINDAEGNHLYRIIDFLDIQRPVELSYSSPVGSMKIKYNCLKERRCLRGKWNDLLQGFIRTTVSDQDELEEMASNLDRLIPRVTLPIKANLMRPEGVDEIVESNFI